MQYTNTYFLVLDIETSKEMKYDEKLEKQMPYKVWLSYGVCKLFDIKGKEIKKVRFREWDRLHKFLTYISNSFRKKIMCFVHNLSFEFDFLIKNISKPKKFLCNSSHSVICATLEDFNIEFRCTYQLSRLPLWKIGEMYNFPKLEDDYCNIYPYEDVPEKKWEYCERDCDILCPYILDEVKTYKMLAYLPYTSTGKVRKELKWKLSDCTDKEWDLMPNEDCFNALNKTFRGAITMSNPRFTNKLIKSKVRSFDEKSKYPSIMLCKEFPYTIEKVLDFDNNTYKQYKFWIGKVRLTNIYSKFDWGVMSSNTCEYVDLFNADIFNGKIINCGLVEIFITNVDLELFKSVYHIEKIEFLEFYKCEKYGRLPEPFIELIKMFAEPKYILGKELKEIVKIYGENSDEYREKNKEYMDSKAKLNGIYGMMVQKLTSPEYYIDENYIWHERENEYKCIKGKHLNRNFLFGIFITAYSRYDLVINIIHNCPYNFVYCDTDSIKYIDMGKDFEDLNDDIPEYLQEFKYLKGFNKFEEEDFYTEFITYGAKKYAYIRNGEFGFTVAGLPKSTKINSFDEFKLDTIYKNCKLAKRYIYHNVYTDIDEFTQEILQQFYEENGEIYDNGGIALFETDYHLNMTESDKDYIERNSFIWQKRNIQQHILI